MYRRRDRRPGSRAVPLVQIGAREADLRRLASLGPDHRQRPDSGRTACRRRPCKRRRQRRQLLLPPAFRSRRCCDRSGHFAGRSSCRLPAAAAAMPRQSAAAGATDSRQQRTTARRDDSAASRATNRISAGRMTRQHRRACTSGRSRRKAVRCKSAVRLAILRRDLVREERHA